MGTIRNLMIRLGIDADVDAGLKKVADSFSSNMDKLKTAAGAAGALVGAGLTAGIVSSMNAEAANDKLAAQLGATGPESERLGKVAGELYAKAYGDSLGDVNDAIKSVIQNIGGMADTTDEDLKAVAAMAMNVGKAFDQDIGQVSVAVGQMLKTGMAINANEAFNILTKGFQQGNDKAGDLLDTFNEYGTQFREMGLTGKEAMGLITQGLQAGARDADIVADAIKEFTIRAKDGSESTAEGFKSLGLGWQTMASDVAAGGDKASGALDQTLDALRNIKDPVERSRIAVQLFGTQAEDLGQALYALDPSTAVKALGDTAFAAENLGKTMNDNGTHRIEEFKRSFEMMLQQAAGSEGPMGTASAAVAAFGAPALSAAGDIGALAAGFGGMAVKAGSAVLGVVTSMGAMVGSVIAATATTLASIAVQGAKWAWLGIQSMLHAAKVAAAWLIAMGPIGIIIAAVIAIVALIVANWDTIKEVIGSVWEWIQEKTSAVWEWIKSALAAAGRFIVDIFMNWTLPGLIMKHWDTIKAAATTVWNWLVAKVKEAGQFILNIFLNWTLPGLILKHWDSIKAAALAAWNWVVEKVKGAVLGIANAVAGIAAIPGKVSNWFNEMKDAAVRKALELVSWLASLPNRIIASLGNVGSMLYNAGRSILQGLVNGILSMAQAAYNSAAEVLGRIRSLFPFSPAKEGPFSGKGWVLHSGKSISQAFADGLRNKQGSIVKTATGIMNEVSGIFSTPLEPSVSPIAYGSATPSTVEGMGSPVPSYGYQRNEGSSGGRGDVNIENLNLTFEDDRDMYQKGADFAAGLRAYASMGGVLPTNG